MLAVPDHRAEMPVIAVADDDDAVLSSIKFSLEIEGFSVITFPDGQSMLDKLDCDDCACIILDQNMPGLTGMDAVAKLRRKGVTTPVILITSLPSAELKDRARLRAIEVVEKPLLGNQLIESIRKAIGR